MSDTSASSIHSSCNQCGQPVEAGWKLCPYCGNPSALSQASTKSSNPYNYANDSVPTAEVVFGDDLKDGNVTVSAENQESAMLGFRGVGVLLILGAGLGFTLLTKQFLAGNTFGNLESGLFGVMVVTVMAILGSVIVAIPRRRSDVARSTLLGGLGVIASVLSGIVLAVVMVVIGVFVGLLSVCSQILSAGP